MRNPAIAQAPHQAAAMATEAAVSPMRDGAAAGGAVLMVHTSDPVAPGPFTSAELAKLVASSSLGESTELWLSSAAGKGARHRLKLVDLVDLEDASEVDRDDDDEIQELAAALTDGLTVEDEPEVGTAYIFDATAAYTDDEIEAIAATRAKLLRGEHATDAGGVPIEPLDPAWIGERELVVTVLNCKLDVEKAASKYRDYLSVLKEYGLGLPASLHSDDWAEIEDFFKSYYICGPDKQGRSVMWINGGNPIMPEDESKVVRAGALLFFAVHSDLVTLRNGLTFVIDTTDQPETKIGNERKLQETWQKYPLRPQNIFILGASPTKRLFINVLLKLVALVSSSKVISTHASMVFYLYNVCAHVVIISWLFLLYPLFGR